GLNDKQAGASDIGRFSSSTRLDGLSVSTGVGTGDIDYYKFILDNTPGSNDKLSVGSLAASDGMVINLYSAPGQAARSPNRTSTGGAPNLAGLPAGTTYWIRVASKNASGAGIATIYHLDFTLGAADPASNVRSFSTARPVQNSDTSDVILGGP